MGDGLGRAGLPGIVTRRDTSDAGPRAGAEQRREPPER